MKNVKAFIFDMDGVLLDTESLCKKCWRLAAQERGLSDVDTVYYKCVGQASQDTLRTLQNFWGNCDSCGNFDAREWYDYAKSLFYKVEKSDGLEKMHGAEECLKRLKNKGYTLALASSTRRSSVERQLTNAGLINYFKTLTCGDSVKHSKPDPEIYINACASLGLKPEECAAVEDSPNGVLSAYSAGLSVIMVPDQIQPAEEIKKLCTEIFSTLDEIEPA